jgi:hypothetical protein
MISEVLFSVSGSGAFPFTLLQRGRCYPVDEKDVDSLFNYSSQRTVNLCGQDPNDTLWKTFGWTIIIRPPSYEDDYNEYHTWPC